MPVRFRLFAPGAPKHFKKFRITREYDRAPFVLGPEFSGSKALRETAQRQALDRKIRQLQIDLPALERDLNKGDAKAQIESKVTRIEAVLNEFETDPWLSRRLNEYDPEFSEKLKVLRNNLSNLKSN